MPSRWPGLPALSFRGRLVAVSLAIAAVSLLAVDTFVSPRLDATLVRRLEEDLAVRARLLAREAAEGTVGLDDKDAWEELARGRAALAEARITIVRGDGVVLGDSEVSREGLEALENHAARAEVDQALRHGSGAATRFSQTLGRRMSYVAAAFSRGGAVAGVVRLARPLTEVDAALAQFRRELFVGTALALLVALAISWLAAQRLSERVRELTGLAGRLAAGDLGARGRPRGRDELARLGAALNTLADNLSRSLLALRNERDLVQGMISAMQEGVLLVGADGRIAMVNPALREMLLLGPEVLGKTVLEVIRRGELQALIQRARASTSAVADEIEVSGVKPRQLLAHALALPEPQANVLVVIVDVTILRRLESVRKDFVANASHELRTPVTGVLSAAETLRSAVGRGPEVAMPFVDIVQRNAERLRTLVEDLLDLGRIESRELQLRVEALELGQVVASVSPVLQDRAGQRRIALETRLPADLPPLAADRRALEQVLSNLIDNAIKYCPEGSRVVLGAAPNGDHVRVTVADDGAGIGAEHLPRLFERFYRVDAGRSRELGGTGLGLAIVKHLVEAMGGNVGVDSTLGRGTTFSFTLPRAA